MTEERKQKRIKKPKSLNFILWLSFFVFALVVILVYGVAEMALLHQTNRDNTLRNLDGAVKTYTRLIEETEMNYTTAFLTIANEYGVTVRVVDENGVFLYPHVSVDPADAIVQEELLAIKDNLGKVYEVDANVYAYADKITVNGSSGYLYITDHADISGSTATRLFLQTAYIALVLVIVASFLSGLLSSTIVKPISELNEKAQQLGYGNLSVDFTRQKGEKGYRELDELSESLNYAESELSKADKMQKEVIANVSHDFKTPLTMIKAYASMIQEISGENPEKRKKHTQVIIDESDRLATLVNDMLDLSKISAGLTALKPSLFNLSDYTREIVERFGYLSETQGYRFKCDIADNLFIEADKDKIGQVLYNLIGNAVNYTGEDKKVTVRLYGENGILHFSVKDTGVGIPPEEIQTIWERYYRSSETHKRPIKGTGLGLSIVKAILTKHGFHFGIRSEVGKGSTFFVDFPSKTAAEISNEEEEGE